MRHIRERLTYANVMSSIAVFLVIGGATAFAALGKNTVGTKQLKKNAVIGSKVKDGSLTGADINLSSLGTVPSATHASSADNATHATNADNATNATNATNAGQLGGTPASGYVKGPLEAVHLVGAAGQPAFQNSCHNRGGGFQPAGFYKDPFGIVHLVGDIDGCSSATVTLFTLPAGFRPATEQRFVTSKTDTTVGVIRVDSNGEVHTFSSEEPILNGMTFRTD